MNETQTADARYVIALDQGTTSSRALLFDTQGRVCGSAQRPFTQIYPQPGWVEHDPTEILSSQLGALTELIIGSNVSVGQIDSIGITNQRETTVVWERASGLPIANAIVWQCRRTAELVERICSVAGVTERIREKTGLIPDAYFSASKLRWILDSVPGAQQRAEAGELCFGTIDSWLIWTLTQGKVHACDYTNASRTMLFDIHRGCWDPWLLELFGVPAVMLPEARPSSGDFGITANPSVIRGVPIRGVAGDQQAALFGQRCFSAGKAKNTYGTGCFLLMHTGDVACRSTNQLVTTIAASASDAALASEAGAGVLAAGAGGAAGAGDAANLAQDSNATPRLQYALEGSVFVAGALIQWLRDELGLIAEAADSEALAKSVPDSGGVFVVPAFTGLGAPWWDADARGLICGLTRGTSRAHIVRAALESLAYQVNDLIEAIEDDSGLALEELRVDGGAATNDFLMRFQSGLLGAPVLRPANTEATALGAAFLAGLHTGFWQSLEEIESLDLPITRFEPNMSASERNTLLLQWHEAVRRTRSDFAKDSAQPEAGVSA